MPNWSTIVNKVIFDKVQKQLEKLPEHVVEKLIAWARSVELKGLREVRKISGYHDEPLKGPRRGERSVRLTRSYRAIYIEEVNKHEY